MYMYIHSVYHTLEFCHGKVCDEILNDNIQYRHTHCTAILPCIFVCAERLTDG